MVPSALRLSLASHSEPAVFFKAAAVFTYLFCTWFSENFVLTFVLCVLLLAFDFWTVKNVTGRLLVGLRWWNEVDEDGSSKWVYESKPATRKIHPADSLVFWGTLYATPIVWIVLFLTGLSGLKIQWLLVVVVALVLNVANVLGYWKCQVSLVGVLNCLTVVLSLCSEGRQEETAKLLRAAAGEQRHRPVKARHEHRRAFKYR
jgi:hypothetical protein